MEEAIDKDVWPFNPPTPRDEDNSRHRLTIFGQISWDSGSLPRLRRCHRRPRKEADMEATPKLSVRLAGDTDGKPSVVERGGRHHYKVVFEVDDAPPDAYAATFELDPSYYDPLRTLKPDSDGKFRLETTAYGNYPVVVRLHRKGGDVTLKANVAQALRTSVSGATAPAWQDAVSYIATH
jgi:hypothetical protein